MRTAFFTAFALAAFAANSLLGRLALGGNAIDAASYTAIRIVSGAAALLALVLLAGKKDSLAASGSWPSALALFFYAAPFSLAYRTIPAGVGALVLFGCVQATSGVGYAAWYAALPGLTATRAASVQLAVPVLAAAGAVAWLGERVTARLVLASLAILGGVAIAVAGRSRIASGAPGRRA